MKSPLNTKLLLAIAGTCLFVASVESFAARTGKVVKPYNPALNSVTAGGSCASPTAFTATPFTDSGTTVGATDIITSVPEACSAFGQVEGPQVVYSFVAGAAANLTFSVTPNDPDYDPAAYLVTSCSDGATCVVGSDASGYGQVETFTANSLVAGTTYYLHIDSYYGAGYPAAYGSGPYSLSVTGTLPVSLQDFSID